MDTYTQSCPPKRRYLELEQKRRIVEEMLAEGASVAQIARLHGVNANLVFNWRRLYRAGQLGGRGGNKLLPVRVAVEDTQQSSTPGARASIASSPGMIQIQLQDVRVWVEGSADPGLVRLGSSHWTPVRHICPRRGWRERASCDC
jgi:transposase